MLDEIILKGSKIEIPQVVENPNEPRIEYPTLPTIETAMSLLTPKFYVSTSIVEPEGHEPEEKEFETNSAPSFELHPTNPFLLEASPKTEWIVEYTGVMKTFIVPQNSHELHVFAFGAEGGCFGDKPKIFLGGPGAMVSAVVSVTPGEQLLVLVGGKGSKAMDANGSGGGGGGSFVVRTGNVPVLVAGGGGGAICNASGNPGVTTVKGGGGRVHGGRPGCGGRAADRAGGGGGFRKDGHEAATSRVSSSGKSFVHGGNAVGIGGFGGGAGLFESFL